MLYIILALIISLLVNAIVIEMYSRSKKDNKNLKSVIEAWKEVADKTVVVENKKTEIREKYNEIENDIDNSTGITDGVMPINATKKSGSYRDRGRKSGSSNS